MVATRLKIQQAIAGDGWSPVDEAWIYASASTITVPTGAASRYQKGDKIKFTQTTVKYGVIAVVADTLLTIIINTDYVVTNAAISAIYVSHEENPIGFPQVFNYTPTITGITLGNGTLTGSYNIVGRLAYARVRFVMGSTSSITGAPTFTLPVTALGTQAYYFGNASIDDYGTTEYACTLTIGGSGSNVSPSPQLTNGTYLGRTNVSSTVPMTWAVNDEIRFTLTYDW